MDGFIPASNFLCFSSWEQEWQMWMSPLWVHLQNPRSSRNKSRHSRLSTAHIRNCNSDAGLFCLPVVFFTLILDIFWTFHLVDMDFLCYDRRSLPLRRPVKISMRRPPGLTASGLKWTAGLASLWTACSTCGGRRTAGAHCRNTQSKSANSSFSRLVVSERFCSGRLTFKKSMLSLKEDIVFYEFLIRLSLCLWCN